MIKEKKSEDFTMEEIECKLSEYRQNLSQIESILEREREKSLQVQSSNISRMNELQKLQKDLKNAISFHEEMKKFKLQTDPTIFNSAPLDPSMVGRICTAYYEAEGQWFLAMINEVSEKDKTAEVTWLGYKDKSALPWLYIKVQEALKPEVLEVGMYCDAIYYEEGKWYQATIDAISEHGVHVKYKQYNDVEVVSFDSIRITPEQRLLNQKKKEQSQAKAAEKTKEDSEQWEFKLPDNLKITPADNELQRLTKRKKVKALKQTHKQKVMEKVSKEKQDEWLKFSQNVTKHKYPGMKKIDKK